MLQLIYGEGVKNPTFYGHVGQSIGVFCIHLPLNKTHAFGGQCKYGVISFEKIVAKSGLFYVSLRGGFEGVSSAIGTPWA